jgi:hypothetical protein
MLMLIAAVFSLFFVSSAWAQQPTPGPLPDKAIAGQIDQHKSQPPQQNAASEQRGSEQAPFIVKIIEGGQAQDKTKTDSSQTPHETPKAQGASLSDKIAIGAAIMAGLQFIALIATLWWMRTSGQRQMRAYIFPDDTCTFRWEDAEEGKKRIIAYIMIKNFGQSPGSGFRTAIDMDVFDSDDPPLPIREPDESGGTVVGPTAIRNFRLAEERPVEDFEAIQAEKKFIFVWGKLIYTDVFGKNRWFEFYGRNGRPLPVRIGNGWEFVGSKKPERGN